MVRRREITSYSINLCTKLLTKTKIAPSVKELYEAGQQFTHQLVDYFQIGSRHTLYKILRFTSCQINFTLLHAS